MSHAISIHSTEEARIVAEPAHRWLWQGYLATRMITLMTSRWKAGKTTLISHLLARMQSGGSLADAAVASARVVVVSEEPLPLWLGRADLLGFGSQVHWCCRPFRARPSLADWEQLILEVAAKSPDVVVIDPLAMVLPPHVENNATEILSVLCPLQLLTGAGAAVLILHHPRKNAAKGEMVPRGSGALTGAADILVDLNFPHGVPDDQERRRRLRSASRLHASTSILMELSPDEREYRTVREPPPESFDQNWSRLASVFAEATDRMTRQDVHKYWPPDYDKPSLTTVTRWLERALKENKLERKGKGTYRDPFRYSVPGFKSYVDNLAPLPDLDQLMRSML